MDKSVQEQSFAKISVVVVTYNAIQTLQSCLNSIYRQRYPHLEIVIIDGKSTDGTVELLRDNASRLGFWKSEPDDGIYDAMNKAIDHCTGQWMYFLGSDDELFDDFSSLAFELRDPSAIYYGSVLTRGLKRWGFESDYQQAKHGIFHQAIVYPAAVFQKYRYDLRYPIFADAVLNMKCHGDRDFRFEFRDYVVANFNHTGTSGSKKDLQYDRDKSRLILENFGWAIWARYLFRQWKQKRLLLLQ